MKKLLVFLLALIFIMLSSCKSEIKKYEDNKMNLYIDNEKIDVSFLDNDSVKDLCSLKPLTITMTRYGGFEQVGEIGKIIKSNDYRMTTEPGDIVLYNSNNIVIFFGSNTWEYTKLGHINLTKEELKKILDKEKVNLRIE